MVIALMRLSRRPPRLAETQVEKITTMKTKSILITICLLSFAAVASAQNTIKLFDPVPITVSDDNIWMNSDPYGSVKSVEVYLSCPTTGAPTSSVSGPNGGDFIVDNFLSLNGSYLCNGSCFSSPGDPLGYLGMPAEASYGGVPAVDVSSRITGTGLYTFHLLDFGYTYASSAVYLNTSCSTIPVNTPPESPTNDGVICHRNNGSKEWKTLTVGLSAVPAHLAHGDTLGPCGQ